ncbi:hypothetical protein ABT369_38755 [Dactylosporangium sp. NPDC000244]|uniref:hypothetical protein n=1 Tax=Dactylosporangium sp. NPDC000244 TaxID=3154365 RepID=UPI003324844C
MTRRARCRHHAALALMTVALACIPADLILAAEDLNAWRWITLPTLGISAAAAMHLRGWAVGYEAAQPRTEPDPRRTR